METKHRILIVSTDQKWAELCGSDLAKTGVFHPEIAHTPEGAMEILMHSRKFVGNFIQCIILDMTPEDEKAFAFIREWQTKELFFNHIPILGITTADNITLWDRSMESRLSYYLYKPVSLGSVLQVMEDIVIRKQLKKYTDRTKHLGRYRVVAPRNSVRA